MKINSVADLRNWVDSHLLDGTEEELASASLWIIYDSERPQWGADWESYLTALPEDLRELLAE